MEGLEQNKYKTSFLSNEPIDCQFNRMHVSMNIYTPTQSLINQNKEKFKSNILKKDN
mgnify:CR=1 FL=1